MSVLIKGMEMPTEAGKYRIEFDQYGNPYMLSDNGDGGIWHIIPVTPHGRLIDADKLLQFHGVLDDGIYYPDAYIPATAIKSAPTIIQAEEGET